MTIKDNEMYSLVPTDFPRPFLGGAVPGAQPKFLAVKYGNKFYSPGCSPPEILERWEICEDLANQLKTKSLESKNGKRAHMTEVEILDQYLVRLNATDWVSTEEASWIIRRTGMLLKWPVPDAANAHLRAI